VAVLARLIEVRDLADGEVLIEEGARDSHLSVVVSGTVSVAKHTPGGGWNVLLMLRPGTWPASCRSWTATRAMQLWWPRADARLQPGPGAIRDTADYASAGGLQGDAGHHASGAHGPAPPERPDMEMQNYFLKTADATDRPGPCPSA